MNENRAENRRDNLLNELKLARERLKNKALNGKIFDEAKERIRIGWMQTWIKAIQTEATILKDVELDELKDEIEKVKLRLNEEPVQKSDRLNRLRRIEDEQRQYVEMEG